MRKKVYKVPMTEDDIEILIKMENLIGGNSRKIFGKDKDKPYYWDEDDPITYDDFWVFWELIDRVLMATDDERTQNRFKGKKKKAFIRGKYSYKREEK